MGAIWNFNRVFELATGEYFMWAAHDDLRDPRYVSACLAAMQSHPDAVLCCTDILFLDEGDLAIEVPPHVEGIRPTGKTPRDRLRQVARACNWYEVYGLTRTAALRETRRAVPTWGFDVVVVLELCLHGPVLFVPEPLRFIRSPVPATPENLAAGRQIYQNHCAVCHGPQGKGNGPLAATLNPRPVDLTVHARLHTEGELYFWVTNGIKGSAMPPWGESLNDTQRWQVVGFIRTLALPTPAPTSAP